MLIKSLEIDPRLIKNQIYDHLSPLCPAALLTKNLLYIFDTTSEGLNKYQILCYVTLNSHQRGFQQ